LGAATGLGAGFGAVFLGAAFLGAAFLAAGLRFATAFRADALRAVAFLAAVFLRAEAFALGLRDAAARFAFLGFLDFVAFAMIDLPILLAIHFNATVFLARFRDYS
jgi:hypothetical protein